MKRVTVNYMSEQVVLCFTDDDRGLCPVCGREEASSGTHAWAYRGEDGTWDALPSFEICPDCRTQFGYDDSPGPDRLLKQNWSHLRERFLAGLAPSDWQVLRAEQMKLPRWVE